MQLFPTAFWKHGFTNIPDGEDSCYECINTTVLDADDNSYRLKIATTPDAEGSDGVGLYKDYSFVSDSVNNLDNDGNYSLHNIKYGKDNVKHAGLPIAHLNRADGRKTRYTNSDGDIIDNVYDEDYNPNGVVFTAKPPLTKDLTWKGWDEFWNQYLENTSGLPTESTILDHWLYIWMEQSTFEYPYNSGVDYPLHKTSPVTITSTTNCKKATVTCYFEKDVMQKLYELQEGPASIKGGSTTALAKHHKYEEAKNSDLYQFTHWGFNGSRETVADMVNFYYRQKAKARLKFKLGSAKDLKIKIKGLGTDFHNQFPEASQRNIGHSATFVSRKYSFFDEDPEDQKKAGLYAITPDLIKQDLEGLNRNANEPNLYAQPGDVQSCTIFFDNEEKIKCVAPVLNYYEGSAVLDLIYRTYPHQLKGPVRIFELESIGENDDGGIIKNYKGVRAPSNLLPDTDPPHPVEGLGYIEESEYPDEYDYSRWLESDIIINPYGKQWTEGEDYFYDGGSNMITPDYYSPYEYEHTLSNVSAGEHTIDIVFDSVAEMFNGGAYYEIEISHT